MKTIILTFAFIFSLGQGALANQQNFHQILADVQDSMWAGKFDLSALGLVNCGGPIVVKFFPEQTESFSNGIETVSYRHDADFSRDLNPLCQLVGKKASVVDVGNCKNNFPMKYSPEEGINVPFRTIIPTKDGQRAFVNSPSCGRNGTINRSQFEMTKAILSPDHNKLDLIIHIVIGAGLPLPLEVDVNYHLHRLPKN